MTEVSEDLLPARAYRGISTLLAVLCTWKGNRAGIEGIGLGEEDRDWVERGLPKKECRLRRGLCEARAGEVDEEEEKCGLGYLTLALSLHLL